MPSKILFTGDIFRPFKGVSFFKISDQNFNISVLHHLLAKPLGNIATIDKLIWNKIKGEEKVNVVQIYKNENLRFSVKSWSILSGQQSLSLKSQESLGEVFSQYDLIIGFELPQFIKNFLEKKSISYIDFVIHPIRFLSDIFFAVYSNDKKYQNLFSKIKISDAYLKQEAAKNIKKNRERKNFNLPKDSAIILGQTRVDRALFSSEGKIQNIYEFEKEIRDLSKKYENIFYKKHPNVWFITPKLQRFLQALGIKIIDQNIYELFCDKNLKYITSISSGACQEARFFAKESSYLSEKNLFKDLLQEYIPVFPSYLYEEFWLDNTKEIKNELSCNQLRNSFAAFWGYNN